MPKDLRDIIKEAEHDLLELPKDHRKHFEGKLDQLNKPKVKSNFFFLKIAASLVLLVSLGYFVLQSNSGNSTTPIDEVPELKFTSLGSVSPEMQKIENYYLTAINYELVGLKETSKNKKLLDDYLEKIGKLDTDYKRLNKELSEKGINEKTINALITNLQLRLQLLLQLKDQLNELKTANTINNEENTI